MPRKPRETVRYAVRHTNDGLILEKFVARRLTLDNHRYTEIKEYMNGRLYLIYTRSGHGKALRIPQARTPQAAFSLWQRGEHQNVKYAERELKEARANCKLKIPKDW